MLKPRYIPIKKRSKKAQRKHYTAQRADWNGVIPITKVIPDKRKTASAKARVAAGDIDD